MAHGLLSDPHDSEDAVQQTWLTVLSEPRTDVLRPRTWLAKIARGRSIDAIRRQRVRRAVEANDQLAARSIGPAEELVLRSVQETVLTAVQELSEPYRTTVQLRYYEGLPPREIARRLDVPVETVRSRIKRALRALRGRLTSEFGGRDRWIAALLPLLPPAAGPPPSARRIPWAAAPLAALAAALALAFVPGIAGPGTASHPGAEHEGDARTAASDEGSLERTPLGDEPGSETSDPGFDGFEEGGRRAGTGNWGRPLPVPWIESVHERPRVARRSAVVGSDGAGHASLDFGRARRRGSRRSEGLGPRSDAAAPSSEPLLAIEVPQEATPQHEELEPATMTAKPKGPARLWRVGPSALDAPAQAGTHDSAGDAEDFGREAADFSELSAAVEAASPGDAILLEARPEGYDALRLQDKGLVLMGVGAEPPLVRGLIVQNLAREDSVVLRGLRIEAAGDALNLIDARGTVWIEDCRITSEAGVALTTKRSASVVLLRSGVETTGRGAPCGTAFSSWLSHVNVFDSRIIGARGISVPQGPTPQGLGLQGTTERAAARVVGGGLYASRTHFQIEDGVGLLSEGHVRTVDCGCATEIGWETSGPIERADRPARSYGVRSPLVSDGNPTLEIFGEAGDQVLSLVSTTPMSDYLSLHGARLIAPPYAAHGVDVLPIDGRVEREFVLAPVEEGTEGDFRLLFLQGFFFTPDGQAYLGSGTALLTAR